LNRFEAHQLTFEGECLPVLPHQNKSLMTIKNLLQRAREKLAPDPLARLEAEMLLCHALGVSRSFLFANPDLEVPLKRRSDFMLLLRRRSQGEPMAYVLGKRSFWTFDLTVTPDVLIPRPETEMLIELALERIPRIAHWRIADIGTGSGAIALALASERPGCEVHATDLSEKALRIARENSSTLKLGRIQFHEGSWLQPLTGRFHLLASNPPYVPKDDPHMRQGDCRYEPEMALSPGADGMAAIREITLQAMGKLETGGWLLIEHGHDQGADVRTLFLQSGLQSVSTYSDMAGLERVCVGQLCNGA